MRNRLIVAALLLTGACANKASDKELLASDLIFEITSNGWTYEVILDPRISRHPEIARLIMSAKSEGVAKPDDACDLTEKGEPTCFETHDITVVYTGTRLLSLIDEVEIDHGMHPVVSFEGHIFDIAEKREIPFEGIFIDWSEARSRLQRQFCRKLRQEHPDAEKCPAVEEQGLSLTQSGVVVNTHDYQLGAYPLGRATILVTYDGDRLDPEFLSLMRREYRAEFPATVAPAERPPLPEPEYTPAQVPYFGDLTPNAGRYPRDAAAAASEAARLAAEAASGAARDSAATPEEPNLPEDYQQLWNKLKEQ